MSPARRRQLVDREHPSVSLVRQCALPGVSRSSLYCRPQAASEEDLFLMGEIDRQYLETPFLRVQEDEGLVGWSGIRVSRKRVQRLMRAMGLRAITRRPSTSRWSPEHPVYPYLLRNVRVTRPNQSLPPTPMVGVGGGHHLPAHAPGVPLPVGDDGLAKPVRVGLAAVQHTGGRLLRRSPGQGPAEVFNTDQGSQFTSLEFTRVLQGRGVRISIDGQGAVPGQPPHGAAVADGEARGGVPESLRHSSGGPTGADRLFTVLQRTQAASGPVLTDSGRGPP